MDSHQPSRLLRSFERYLRAGNRSERTVGNYMESARQAEAFLSGRGIRLEDPTRADLEETSSPICSAADPPPQPRPATSCCMCRTGG